MGKRKNRPKTQNGKPLIDPNEGREITKEGVSVSKKGDDRGPTIVRKNQDGMSIIIEEFQQTVRDRRAPIARRQSHVDRLLAAHKINRRLHDAGEQFKRDYDLAGIGGFMPPRYESVSSSTVGVEIVRGEPRAKNNIFNVIERLGGNGSTLANVVSMMIGEEKPMSQLVGDVSLGGKQRKSWDDILLEGLNIVADYYLPQRRA